MQVRARTQLWESEKLSPYASLSAKSKGRVRFQEECPLRTVYQRDRDRITHSKAFRRLKHKTQVFLSPEGDHYRTRLTHTLEVSQIARTIARALLLNEDLTEAIALGHDLGHTPFGHAGERALDALSPDGFRHYEQSVRVVEKLEDLNLTYEVKNGILCHTKGKQADTLEGQVVRIADRIGYINHDIDDAIRAGVITESDIPKELTQVLGNTTSKRINTLVLSLVENSAQGVLQMDATTQSAFDRLHSYMYQAVYKSPYAKKEEKKVPDLVERLYCYFLRHTEKLDSHLRQIAREEGAHRAVCDYIAAMTDHYAVSLYQEIFIPKSWHV
ncbi:MAG: deoxyguanosinetriphosphate triphosphohydrolase [Acutalibacteraceae bacterium]|nr:deoxyguanosinetriphosphate triphosphohydrolase [Acutalibacteraceae bacterium]HIR03262.1 deoxyguanosinetriphosphate triphosphohydrolase [Candidatus Scatovicinus merdipullorum]